MRKNISSDSRADDSFQLSPLVGEETNRSDSAKNNIACEESGYAYEVTNELVDHLYQVLSPCIRSWVYRANVSCWKGQEYDLAEDLLQVALMKIITYLEHCRRYMIPIYALEQLSKVIAKRCFLDLMKRDRRLQRFGPDESEMSRGEALVDPAQEAEEHIYEEELLISSVQIIATFPAKLRQAILSDLARHSSFTVTPTVLQQAFLDLGIDLQKYVRQVPTSKVERGKQTALRSLAYKRVAEEIHAQEEGTVEADATCIRENPELTLLAFHLQQTKQFVAKPSFHERLRAQLVASSVHQLLLMDTFPQPFAQKALVYAGVATDGHLSKEKGQEFQCLSARDDGPKRVPSSSPNISHQLPRARSEQPGESHREPDGFPDLPRFAGHGEPDMAKILDDPELDWLAKLLYAAATPVPIDPAFKETLFQKLLEKLPEQPKEEKEC